MNRLEVFHGFYDISVIFYNEIHHCFYNKIHTENLGKFA